MGRVSSAEALVRTSFLSWIKDQEESERLQNYRHYDNYYDGEHLNTLPSAVRETFENPFSVICNYCRPVVDVVTDYICGSPVGIDVIDVFNNTSKDDRSNFVERILNHYYRINKFHGSGMKKLVTAMSKKGDSFVKVGLAGEGENVSPTIKVIRPSMIFPDYSNDDYDIMESCTHKFFGKTESGDMHWFAHVYFPDRIDVYDLGEMTQISTNAYTENEETGKIYSTGRGERQYGDGLASEKWQLIDRVPAPIPGIIPIIHFRNGVDDLPFGVSDLLGVTPLQDALNKAVTDLYHVLDYQAFQRLFIFGSYQDGDIDISPGTATVIPGEGSLQVINPVNIGNFLAAIQETVSQISAVSRTPRQVFLGYQNIPISGYALKVLFMFLEHKCTGKKAILEEGLQEINRILMGLMEMLNVVETGYTVGLDTNINFTSGIPEDIQTMVQVHAMQQQMATKSRATMMEEQGVENVDEELQRVNADYGFFAQTQEAEEADEEKADDSETG